MATYTIDTALRLVTISYDNVTSLRFEEWKQTMDIVFSDPAFKPGYSLLFDRRSVTSAPEKDMIMAIAGYIQNHMKELKDGRTAMVVGEIASFGMMRMLQGIIGQTEQFRIFTDMAQARRWVTYRDMHDVPCRNE